MLHLQHLGDSGEPLALVHGNAPPGSLLPLAERLSDAFRVIVVRRAGFGGSASIPAMGPAQTTDAILDALQGAGAERFHLVGHSYGAYLAMMIAERAPQWVSRLSLLAPLAHLEREEAAVMRADR